MALTPEQQQAITQRAEEDAVRAVDEAISRMKAAGLRPTEKLIRAYIQDHALPELLASLEEDIEAGKFNEQPRKKFFGLF